MSRPRGNRKEARLSVSLDEQEYSDLRDLARRNDVSVAWLVRQAIYGLIKQKQDTAGIFQLSIMRSMRDSRHSTLGQDGVEKKNKSFPSSVEIGD
jgi:predicted DNA-binding ribbon-helix-helix protein